MRMGACDLRIKRTAQMSGGGTRRPHERVDQSVHGAVSDSGAHVRTRPQYGDDT